MNNSTNIYAVCFSPNGLTRQLTWRIAYKLGHLVHNSTIVDWDFTLPSRRATPFSTTGKDWVIVGLPVYAGRLPNLLLPYLNSWAGNGAIAVPIVTFGNRSYGNALIELKELLELKGFTIAGAAAFVAEHSFAPSLAKGRPNSSDFHQADQLADKVYMRWKNAETLAISINIPGQGAPEYGGYYQPLGADGMPVRFLKSKPTIDHERCRNCGICAEVCPMGSIEKGNYGQVTGTCIKCNACIKTCPTKARHFTDEAYISHIRYLEENYANSLANNELF